MKNNQVQNYVSKRNVMIAKNAAVATSHPLAAQAGLDMIKKGGNAIDAAIATAAMLTVVEPTSNGIGGDAFAIIWTKDKLHGLNSSGYSPALLSKQKLNELGIEEIPTFGFTPVMVPGVPAAWAELSKKFGKLPFKDVLQPAIDTARFGHAVAPTVSKYWKKALKKYKEVFVGEEFENWFNTFAPNGVAPETGEIWKSENHATTLESIANTNAESVYKGELADKIDEFSKKHNGFIRKEDLEQFTPDWVEPISVNYKGYEVCEIPPNGQGIAALMALNIFKNLEISHKESADTYHKLIESMKLAFVDTKEYVADIRHMDYSTEELLSEKYGKDRANEIGCEAMMPTVGEPPKGGTIYLCTADSEGNMVSYIQSNYMGFGSGIVVPGTGIAFNNRGHNFNLKEGHPNCLEGRKKPYNTIIPGFLMKDGKPVGPFGVMGGFMQPQGHFQVITNTVDFLLNPQDALDAPRWQWMEKKKITVEQNFPNNIIQELVERGHEISVEHESGSFGRGQIIWRDEHGVLFAGTESRCDGYIAVM